MPYITIGVELKPECLDDESLSENGFPTQNSRQERNHFRCSEIVVRPRFDFEVDVGERQNEIPEFLTDEAQFQKGSDIHGGIPRTLIAGLANDIGEQFDWKIKERRHLESV